MKQLNITWNGTSDTTGYLHSFAKSLSAVVRHSPYSAAADDIIASSGFAFRMWVAPDLCPSAMSIWDFASQKPWVENGGLVCEYVQRLWGEDAVEEERRNAAVAQIRRAIDSGTGAVAWDVSGCEWGVITGYDDDSRTFAVLRLDGAAGSVPYDTLGLLELPILSVLTVTGANDKPHEQLVRDTVQLAASHLRGEEWCNNAKGLAAYPALIGYLENTLREDSWNLEYYLGTYAALKDYAVRFFAKYGCEALAAEYRIIADAWMTAFRAKASGSTANEDVRAEIVYCLQTASEAETRALALMEAMEK